MGLKEGSEMYSIHGSLYNYAVYKLSDKLSGTMQWIQKLEYKADGTQTFKTHAT